MKHVRVRDRDRVWGNKAAYDQICSRLLPQVRHGFDSSDARTWNLVNQIRERIADLVRSDQRGPRETE